jgi:hypothetical protein
LVIWWVNAFLISQFAEEKVDLMCGVLMQMKRVIPSSHYKTEEMVIAHLQVLSNR